MVRPSKKPTSRVKPTVAFANAEAASNNIEIKQKALEHFYQILAPSGPRSVTDVDAASLRGLLPTSLRQFNSWDSAQLPSNLASLMPVFTRNAPATLRASPSKQALVQKLVSSIRAIFDSGLDRPEPVRIATQRRLKSLAITLREIAERALKAEMKRSIALQSEVDLLRKSLNAFARESQEALDARDEIIAKLRAVRPERQVIASLRPLRK